MSRRRQYPFRMRILVALALGVAPAQAQLVNEPAAASEQATEHAGGGERRAQAKRLFEAGLELALRGDFVEAAKAFELAQDLVPHPTTLLNLGLAYSSLGRAADASGAFSRYLEVAPTDTPPELLRDVRLKLDELRDKVGEVSIDVSPSGAQVALDGRSVPLLSPVRVDAGPHVVTATLAGHDDGGTSISVLPGRLTQVQLTLSPIPELWVTCPIPGVRIMREGQLLATTRGLGPDKIGRLQRSETYLLERRDYEPQRIKVEAGTNKVECNLRPKRKASRLLVNGLGDSATLVLDGASFVNGSALPSGPHLLRVTRAGFVAYVTAVDLPEGSVFNVEVNQRPTAAWRESYEQRANDLRLASHITVASGLSLMAASLATLAYNTSRTEDMARRGELQPTTRGCDADQLTSTAKSICGWDTAAYWGLGIGGAGLLAGGALRLLGPAPDLYMRDVHVSSDGRLLLRGAF